jgi:hypothetical protein
MASPGQHLCRKMTDGSLRQSCLAQALNEADVVLRPADGISPYNAPFAAEP